MHLTPPCRKSRRKHFQPRRRFESNLTRLGIETGPVEYATEAEGDQAMRTMVRTSTRVQDAKELFDHFEKAAGG